MTHAGLRIRERLQSDHQQGAEQWRWHSTKQPRAVPRTALFLAQACSLAYCDEPEAAQGFRELLGLDARLINADNTQVYLAQNDKAIVVAFRGSQGAESRRP